MYFITMSVALHLVITSILVIKYNFSLVGTSISCLITNLLLFACIYVYTNWYSDEDIKSAVAAPDMQSVDQGLVEYLILGI
jgi:predicted transporter